MATVCRELVFMRTKNSRKPQTMLNILIADDDEGDRKQMVRALKKTQLAAACTETTSIADALQACENVAFDCALVDYRLSGQDGLTGITALHERLPNMAIVMVTGQGDELVAVEAMRRGALDYMPKASISTDSIKRTIENAVAKAILMKTVAEQRHELEVFSRVLAHDLRQPIHSALLFAGLIEDKIDSDKPEKTALYCRSVVTSLERMGVMIDTLHKYTDADESIVFKSLDMGEVMTDTLTNLEHLLRERGARVTYSKLPAVSGTAQLTQLLQNLIGNGIKYCEAEVPTIHVSATPQDDEFWLFSVTDNGIGIPEDQYQQVFAPFHRLHTYSKYKGTGLGLATCKKIVERHGGTISCSSEPGRGSTFSFTLQAVGLPEGGRATDSRCVDELQLHM
jgi:signal transduction histidine kinase